MSVGKNKQGSDSIVEKVKREEKNFFVTFSIVDSKTHKMLKDVKFKPKTNIKVKKAIKTREKCDIYSNTGMDFNNNLTQ